MSRAADIYRKKNNKRDREILPENDEIYTDMIAYLRVSDINEYNQEKVREDLIDIIVDGQNRGDDIKKVIGENYRDICDEIIEEMPKKTMKEKIMDLIGSVLQLIWICGLITVGKYYIAGEINEANNWNFQFILGDIISWFMLGIFAELMVFYVIKKQTFREQSKKDKVKSVAFWWIVAFIFFGILMLPLFFLKQVVATVNVGVAIAIFAAVYIAGKLISLKY